MATRTIFFGGLLRQLRKDAGLTQEELAEAASLSPRSISDLERGINLTAHKETVRLLADALNLQGAARTQFEAVARGRVGHTASVPAEPDNSLAAGGGAAMRTLPRDAASFVGRELELAHLTEVLATDTASGGVVGIHAIDGMAGIGKTTFAVHAAHLLAPRFPDGQIFLRLHGHTPGHTPINPADALAILLATVGVTPQQIPAEVEARAGLWRDRMSGKKVLLVLDDATSSDHVLPLLPSAAGTLVLVTSRRRLTALPEATPIALDILESAEATELFVRLTSRHDLRPSDLGVADVVRLCGYLPLAIGLMAGQLKHHRTWSVAELAAGLAAAQDRLATMRAENASIAAVFDLSYGELADRQQRLFRRLGLQPGADIDTYAAAALDGVDLSAASALLDDLYAHHLIDEPSRGRYRFHDLIREYARRLAAADERAMRDAATDRLLRYYLHTARAADRHLARRTPALDFPAITDMGLLPAPPLATVEEATGWMDAERLNLHAAVDYAALHDRSSYAISIPVVMHGFLRTYGHWDQALALYRTALATARRIGDRIGEALALNDLGDIQHLTGDYPAAEVSLSQALKIFRDIGNSLGEANAISYLGLVQHLTGDYPAAQASLSRGLELYRNLGDALGEAVAFNDLGTVQYLTGDYAAATTSQNQALKLYQDLDDRHGQASALAELGAVQLATGNYAAATASQEQALQLYRDLGHRWGQAYALNQLGDIQRLTEDYAAAAASQDRALQLYRDLAYRKGEAETLNSIGELSFERSFLVESHDRHQQALIIARAISSPLQEARALEGIADCRLHEGHVDDEAALLREALLIYRRINSPRARQVEAALRNHHDRSG
jgi:tetratricopeptide (TPR) repeat protein/transcriptional regulator with XRE-family HTH domain